MLISRVASCRHLCFGYDGAVLWRAPVKRGQRRGHDDGTGSDETTQVTAGDLILLLKQPDEKLAH